jgi:negative regulator of flagellin synthesis FlgM
MEISMKIGNSPEKTASTPVGTDRTGAAEAGRGQAKTQPSAVAGGKSPEASTKIALSSNANQLLAGVSEEGSFDAAKVERITQAISQGKFSVNADAVADKLIANAQEMLSRVAPH